jgi:hypothetical protein
VKKSFVIPFILPLFFATSCLTSLHKLTTPQNIVVDDRLKGVWLQQQKTVQIQKLSDTPYRDVFAEARETQKPISRTDSIFMLKHYIITTKENGFAYTWVASMTTIGNQIFVSLIADLCIANGQIMTEGSREGNSFSFALMEWTGDNSFKLRFINGDFVRETILSGKAHLKHEYDPLFGTFVISASQHELELFLKKYGKDERLYNGGNVLLLTRKVG